MSNMPAREAALGATQDAEALLVKRAKTRSPSAWAEIYDTTYIKLYRYCYARTTDDTVASELASRVYLEALEGIDRYSYRGKPLLAWLYRIAHNLVSDHLRKSQRESKAMEQAAALLDRSDPGPATIVTNQQDIGAALSHLTEDQQQVIALRYYASLTTAEIAHTMERSERAVYSLEVRALAAMRRVIEGNEP
jgi:RNA polymerase sigma-70 factor (ECF subfamily)